MGNPSAVVKSGVWERLIGYDLFISHARKDAAELAGEIGKTCKKHGLAAFIDVEGIVQGEAIPARISNGLKRSRILLVLLTREGYRSEWVAKEIEEFGEAKVVIPIIVHDPPKDATDISLGIFKSLGERCDGLSDLEIAEVATNAVLVRRGWMTNRLRFVSLLALAGIISLTIVLATLHNVSKLTLDPDGKPQPTPTKEPFFSESLLVLDKSRLVKGFDDGSVCLINRSGKVQQFRHSLEGTVMDLAQWKDEYILGVALESTKIRCWSLTTLEKAWDFPNPNGNEFVSVECSESQYPQLVALGDSEGHLYLFDAESREEVWSAGTGGLETDRINDLKFTVDGKRLIATYLDGFVGILDLKTRHFQIARISDVEMIYSTVQLGNKLYLGAWGPYQDGTANVFGEYDLNTKTFTVLDTAESSYNKLIPIGASTVIAVNWNGVTKVWSTRPKKVEDSWKRAQVATGDVSSEVYAVGFDSKTKTVVFFTSRQIDWRILRKRTLGGMHWF